MVLDLNEDGSIKPEIKWGKPKTITGNRTSIKSQCGKYCITKQGETYQPMRLKGAIWVSLKKADDLEQAKKIVMEVLG